MSTETTVSQALAAIIHELPGIVKGDKSPQGYAYRGIEAITKQLQPLLSKHGVVIVPQATITNVVPSPGMKESWQDIYMTVQWQIVGPNGDTLTACTTGIGRDNADKGANKAQTQAYKYLLLHLLCIADAKDETDGLSYDHGRRDEQEPPPKTAGQLLLDRILSAPDEVKATVKAFAAENGKKYTAPAFDADPVYAEQVADILNQQVAA